MKRAFSLQKNTKNAWLTILGKSGVFVVYRGMKMLLLYVLIKESGKSGISEILWRTHYNVIEKNARLSNSEGRGFFVI